MGSIVFALGGAILIGLLYNVGIAFVGFIGFLFIGLGLWVIVLSGKPETKQNPSQNAPIS
jgi:hypothetical protein